MGKKSSEAKPSGERKRGRPELKVRPVYVRLPIGVPERIDALVGENRRSEFIREAVSRELARRSRKKEKGKS